MHIGLLLDYSLGDPAKPVINALARELEKRGCDVRVILPGDGAIDLDDLKIDNNVYIAKGHSAPLMALSAILHDRGARLMNPYPASSFVHDKARTTAALMAAGIPVPRSCIAGNASRAARALGGGPIIVKPVNGHRGRGIEIATSIRDLQRINGGPHFAQRYERINGDDLKIYVIGDDVFTLRRRVEPPSAAEKTGRLCDTSPQILHIARTVNKLFGLEIAGLDIVETSHGLVVVDVNSFPSFRGVPDAAIRLADLLLHEEHRQSLARAGLELAYCDTGLPH